jgi:signal transduction histidine kinase
MLRRLSRLRLSLATKSQLLFGIAAGVIILTALGVTWQRIEQLTTQQTAAAADALARHALAAHAATGQALPGGIVRVQRPDGPAVEVRAPRLAGRQAPPETLTPFEQEALQAFADDPQRQVLRREAVLATAGEPREAAVAGLRVAQPALRLASCLACHVPGVPTPIDRPPMPTSDLPLIDGAPDATPALLGVITVEVPSAVDEYQQLLNRSFLLTAAVVSAAMATLTLYLILTRLILRPVRVLQETAERVRGGDLKVRADLLTGDEFETLARTLNEMINVLGRRNEELRRANASLDDRLGQLAAANTALDESNRLKGEFLANVSHELRTPLNSILGFSDLVKSQASTNPKVHRYAENIAKSGQMLLELINELLDLAKIEAGRMEVRRGEVSLSDLFEALTVLLGPVAGRRDVRLEREVGPRVPIVSTDAGKLQQILYNLLSNAIKFSPEGGRVDLVVRRELDAAGEDEPFVRISVTDQGPGIAADEHERIFEKFRQIDATATRAHGGTGLGLAISRELAKLLGGTLWVESTPGHGATFRLRLPVRPTATSR